jgi:hypothetical protein
MSLKVKPIPIYSTVCGLEFQAIHGSIRKHARDSIHHETRYNIEDKLDWIVSDTIFDSVSNNVNATLQDYEYSK